jgi:hypothetical protein
VAKARLKSRTAEDWPLKTGWSREMNLKGKAENLKPFQPGKSGNPGGRPRKRPISERYAEKIETELPEAWRKELGLRRGATYGDAVAEGQVQAAIRGETGAAREIREAIEGRATRRIEIADMTRAEAFDKMTEAGLVSEVE